MKLDKNINRGFYTRLLIFIIILIQNSFLELGFRGIGNIFWGGGILFLSELVADARLGQRFIQVGSDGFFADGKRSNYFRLEFQGWNKRKKGMACSNILWMMSESFSHDDVLDSCVIWRNETNLGKVRCLYIGSHEGS